MKAKEYLQQLKRFNALINQKMKELGDLRAMATCVGGIDYSKERVQTSSSGDAPFVKIMNRMIDLDKEINREIDKYVDEKHKIIDQIQKLQNPDEIKILFQRYVEFKSFEQIAVDMNYTIRNIYFIHGRALKNIEPIILPFVDEGKSEIT